MPRLNLYLFQMEWLEYLQYAPQAIGFVTAAFKTAQAVSEGDKVEALHEASGMVRPILVAAAGKACGNNYDSRVAGGLASAGTGIVFDAGVSVTTQRNYGVVRQVVDESYLGASGKILADFGLGCSVTDDKKEKKKKNNDEKVENEETEKVNREDKKCILEEDKRKEK